MTYIPSAMNGRKQFIYILRHDDNKEYVGITTSVSSRLEQHKKEKKNVSLKHSLELSVRNRRHAEGIEATLHQIQRSGQDAEDYLSLEFEKLHSLWYNSSCKGYPKHLQNKPLLRF